jgi:hypothetical protein
MAFIDLLGIYPCPLLKIQLIHFGRLQVQACLFAFVAYVMGGFDNRMPRANQFVVGSGFFGPFLALAQCVQVVGQLPDGFTFLGHFCK